MIPAYRIEEHHEAFIVWHHASQEGVIPEEGNSLLHVDEHSDWSTPRLSRSLESLDSGLTSVAQFTYDELDIGSFIWPAIYRRTISNVYWLRRRHTIETGTRRMFIRARNQACTEFVTGVVDNGQDTRTANLTLLTPDQSEEIPQGSILDIDLDYFSSNFYPDKSGWRLEITRSAFEDFQSNRYHFLRIAPGSRVSASTEGSRYFLDFDRSPQQDNVQLTSQVADELKQRISTFLGFLERHHQPRLIVVCRSRYSGYTPKAHCSFIEEELERGLRELYGAELKDFHPESFPVQPELSPLIAREQENVVLNK